MDAVRSRDAGDAEQTTELADRDALSGRLAGLEEQRRARRLRRRLSAARVRDTRPSTRHRTRARAHYAALSRRTGALVARCGGERTEVFSVPDSTRNDAVPGCTPAWRPDGMLTVALDRAVVGFEPCSGSPLCPEALIEQGRALPGGCASSGGAGAAHPAARARRRDRLALSQPYRRAALDPDGRPSRRQGCAERDRVLRGRPPRARSAGVHAHDRRQAGRRAERGTYVTQTPDVILRPDGQPGEPPSSHLRDGLAFAWSRDDRFVALATPLRGARAQRREPRGLR